MALLQRLSVFVQGLVGQSTFCLEPHALHLIQILYCRCSFLQETTKIRYTQKYVFLALRRIIPGKINMRNEKGQYVRSKRKQVPLVSYKR